MNRSGQSTELSVRRFAPASDMFRTIHLTTQNSLEKMIRPDLMVLNLLFFRLSRLDSSSIVAFIQAVGGMPFIRAEN